MSSTSEKGLTADIPIPPSAYGDRESSLHDPIDATQIVLSCIFCTGQDAISGCIYIPTELVTDPPEPERLHGFLQDPLPSALDLVGLGLRTDAANRMQVLPRLTQTVHAIGTIPSISRDQIAPRLLQDSKYQREVSLVISFTYTHADTGYHNTTYCVNGNKNHYISFLPLSLVGAYNETVPRKSRKAKQEVPEGPPPQPMPLTAPEEGTVKEFGNVRCMVQLKLTGKCCSCGRSGHLLEHNVQDARSNWRAWFCEACCPCHGESATPNIEQQAELLAHYWHLFPSVDRNYTPTNHEYTVIRTIKRR